MRHIHMMVFVHSSEPAGLPGDLGQPYRAVPGMGLPFGPASPVGMDWACCCEALPCGAGALCMQSVCGESRYLAVLPDKKEIHCSHLDFSWKWSFGGFYTTKKNCCPQPRIGILALLALLPGFSQAAHFSIAWHCQACPCWWPPAFPSLLGELEASLSAVGLMGVSRGTSPLLRDNVSLNQLMKDNWKENKSSWYFGIRSFLNLLAWSNSSTWWKTVSCMKSRACFLFSPSRIHIWHIKWGRAFLIKSKGEAESMWWHLFPHTYNSFLSSHVLLDAKS